MDGTEDGGKKDRTPLKALLLMVLCTVFSSAGQILQKFGVTEIDWAVPSSFFNLPLLAGLGSYVIGAGFMFIALKKGELSLLFPVLATSYVWVSLFSSYFFPDDSMNAWKWLGIAVIIFSITLLGWGSSQTGKSVNSPPAAARKGEEKGAEESREKEAV